jgi:hypothetical protein
MQPMAVWSDSAALGDAIGQEGKIHRVDPDFGSTLIL